MDHLSEFVFLFSSVIKSNTNNKKRVITYRERFLNYILLFPILRVLPKIVGCSVAIVTVFYMMTVISYHSVLDMETMNTAQVAVASVSHVSDFNR